MFVWKCSHCKEYILNLKDIGESEDRWSIIMPLKCQLKSFYVHFIIVFVPCICVYLNSNTNGSNGWLFGYALTSPSTPRPAHRLWKAADRVPLLCGYWTTIGESLNQYVSCFKKRSSVKRSNLIEASNSCETLLNSFLKCSHGLAPMVRAQKTDWIGVGLESRRVQLS